MRAQAKIEGVRAEATSTGFRLTTREGDVHEVPAVTAAVWRAADGRTEAAGLLAAARSVDPAADMALVWSALDALGDAGLLVSRAAPPAGALDRRAAIRTMALAAGAVLAVLPRGARSAEEAAAKKVQPAREQVQKASLKASEQDEKSLRQDEEKMKAEIQAIEARAKEEEAKLAPAARADVAAGRQRESAAKKQITELRAREETRKQSLKASEQSNKAQAL